MAGQEERFDVMRAIEELLRRSRGTGRRSDFKLLPPIYQTYEIAFDLDYAISDENLDNVVMYRAEYVLLAPQVYRAIKAKDAAAFFGRVIEAVGGETKLRRVIRDPIGALSPAVLAKLARIERTYDRQAQDVLGLLDRFVEKNEAEFRREFALAKERRRS